MSRHSGDSSPYSNFDEQQLVTALDVALQSFPGELPSSINVTVAAQIEWAGTFSGQHGYRVTHLENLDLRHVQGLITKARAAQTRALAAGSSFTAKGWKAQYRALTKTVRGRHAADAAGLAITPRTQRAWLAGQRTPTKANRAKIAEAYQAMREGAQKHAYARTQFADHQVADAFTVELRREYQAEIRLRDISALELDR